MTKVFAAFFAMLTQFFQGTEELAHGYSAICRTARVHATAYEKESTLEANAKLKELEKRINNNAALEHQS